MALLTDQLVGRAEELGSFEQALAEVDSGEAAPPHARRLPLGGFSLDRAVRRVVAPAAHRTRARGGCRPTSPAARATSSRARAGAPRRRAHARGARRVDATGSSRAGGRKGR